MPGQQQDTQMISESPMTHISDPLGNQNRINSGMEPPLDEIIEDTANVATLSNDDRVQDPGTGSEIRMERNNSNEPISASASAADAEMLDHQHTQAEQDLIEVEKLNDEAKF